MSNYKNYKSSGQDWLEDIPIHWNMMRGDRLFNLKKDQVSAAELDGKQVFHYSIPVAQETGDGKEEEGNSIDSNKLLVCGEELLVSKLNPRKGTVLCTTAQNLVSVCSTEFVVLEPVEIDLRFAYYLYLSATVRNKVCSYVQSATRSHQRANPSDIYKLWLPIPSDQEQTTIANFLDHKTAQIDEAIALKEQLIELLKEERAAIINEAVIKGIDPDVPMKDSGIEWIGEIPAHWQVKKLRYIGNCQNGISAGAEYFGSGFPFVSYGDVYNNRVLPDAVSGLAKSSSNDQDRYSVQVGDVLFTRTSETLEEIGIASTCLKTIAQATFAGFLIRFRPNSQRLLPNFSKYSFRCDLQRKFFVGKMNIVTRASLSQDLLKELPILLPPLEEQEEISKFLDRKANKIDQETLLTQKEISLLKEYRQALISEAVTGKIDVGDYSLSK